MSKTNIIDLIISLIESIRAQSLSTNDDNLSPRLNSLEHSFEKILNNICKRLELLEGGFATKIVYNQYNLMDEESIQETIATIANFYQTSDASTFPYYRNLGLALEKLNKYSKSPNTYINNILSSKQKHGSIVRLYEYAS